MIYINWEYKGRVVKVEPVKMGHTQEYLYAVEHAINKGDYDKPNKWDKCYLTGSVKLLGEYKVDFYL